MPGPAFNRDLSSLAQTGDPGEIAGHQPAANRPTDGRDHLLHSARLGSGRGGNDQARTMTNTSYKIEAQKRTSLAEARPAPHGGFKRLALPAVAAAVQTLSPAKQRPVERREWPAPMRRDGKPS
jgi:hypothetical protein